MAKSRKAGRRDGWMDLLPGRGWIVLVVVAVAVVFGGLMVNQQVHGRDGSEPVASPSGDTRRKDRHYSLDGPGLEAAGIPVDTKWRDIRVESKTGEVVVRDDGFGPAGAALKALDATLDPKSDDAAYAKKRSEVIRPDPSGHAQPAGDTPRWWLTQRRYTPAKICNKSLPGSLTAAPSCQGDTWDRPAGEAMVLANGYLGETAFPVPKGMQFDSRTDPQSIVRIGYDTLYVPMDDGVWSVTTFCPASMKSVHMDREGNEGPDDARHPYTYVGAGLMPFGTRQTPCYAVDIAVAGQNPFWLVSDGSGTVR